MRAVPDTRMASATPQNTMSHIARRIDLRPVDHFGRTVNGINRFHARRKLTGEHARTTTNVQYPLEPTCKYRNRRPW